ncbi:MAG: alpha-amylase family glycosyl hydrolase, partial [Myxococcota bacterium]
RVDAARHLFESPDGVLTDQPETFDFVARLRTALETQYPSVLLIAEAWTGHETLAPYDDGRGFHMAFDFELAEAIIKGLNEGNATAFAAAVASRNTRFRHADFPAPFLTNHDMTRVLRTLGGDERKARLAAALLLTMAGSPFVYYGEELGLVGGAGPGDKDKRTPIRWDDVASRLADDASLLRLYRRLIALRHSEPALMLGRAQVVSAPGEPAALLRLARTLEDGTGVTLLANLGATPLAVDGRRGARQPLLADQATVDSRGVWALEPYGFVL